MISAQEARAAGPIADYIAVSRGLQAQIWKAIYARQNYVSLIGAYTAAGLHYDDSTAWHHRLVDELEALGYVVVSEYVSW
jgi:hypothetical protein